MGKGGARIFFFWIDTEDGRALYVTDVAKKSALTALRVNTLTSAASSLRVRWLEENHAEQNEGGEGD